MPQIEIFSAGCPFCQAVIQRVRSLAGPECNIKVHDLRNEPSAIEAAKGRGVQRVPSVVVNGKLAECCTSGPVDDHVLRAAGLGACKM
jgi:glutaredoxin 3